MSNLTNPFSKLLEQASSLPGEDISLFTVRINQQRINSFKVLLLDTSSSMDELVGASRKIDLLKGAVCQVDLSNIILISFDSYSRVICDVNQLTPYGSTNLTAGLVQASQYTPGSTLVISDGQPDDKETALQAASRLTGVINTLYIGREENTEAIDFMKQLARRHAGKYQYQNLSSNPSLEPAITHYLNPT